MNMKRKKNPEDVDRKVFSTVIRDNNNEGNTEKSHQTTNERRDQKNKY